MGLRFHRRRSIAKGFWIGVGKSGPSVGRRKGRFSASISRRGPRGSVRLAKGVIYVFGGKRRSR
jgi:hypothetical protein